ncbi:translation initiation factor [Alteromonas mediterranea]|uniref:Translation initiation factor n=1 Tax=Alteromonas mediterranea TaxID=314275 RepID=A0AAC9NQQ2_9ALTE|nr:stress response translation initiation inhibitor YciH [Alteromonas mediterranea]APD89343.1 translation initiation factor [Alteromonas mediterranea]
MQDWQDALLVYSTESGKIKPEQKADERSVSSDGIVRIHRETKGRKGKGVSLIKGLDLPSDDLKKLGSKLKKKCGCGGAVKDGVIEVQTDDREKLRALLTDKGYKVKLAGG